jgi:hypothetical protein
MNISEHGMDQLNPVSGHNSHISQSLDELEGLIKAINEPEITAAIHAMSMINIGSSEEGDGVMHEEMDQLEWTENSSSSYREPDPILASIRTPEDLSSQQGYYNII